MDCTSGSGHGDEEQAWALWVVAQCAVETRHYEYARLIADAALERALKLNHPTLMNAISRTRRAIHLARQFDATPGIRVKSTIAILMLVLTIMVLSSVAYADMHNGITMQSLSFRR